MPTDTKAEKETIYCYVADFKARHPLNPDKLQLRARALKKDGQEIAEFFGDSIIGIQNAIRQYRFTKDYRIAWVDEPDDHPELRAILARDIPEDSAIPRPVHDSQWNRGELALLRSQHHICNGCERFNVCAVATHPMFDDQLVTVAGCLAYRPYPEKDEEDENGVAPK